MWHGCTHTVATAASEGSQRSKRRERNKQVKRGEKEEKRKDSNTEKAEFLYNRVLAGNEETKPTITVLQLTNCDSITVRIHRTALSTRDGDGQ